MMFDSVTCNAKSVIQSYEYSILSNESFAAAFKLWLHYQLLGPLPDDNNTLASLSGAADYWPGVKDELYKAGILDLKTTKGKAHIYYKAPKY
jgi:hypothetical protein